MPIANLAFFVSPKARAAKEAALLEQAAQAFRDRAQALTTAFGYTAYDIKEINLGGSGAQYEAAPRVMAMAAGAQSKVPLEAGTEMVSVSVQGSIFLRSDKK
jgi:predicted secreted protein